MIIFPVRLYGSLAAVRTRKGMIEWARQTGLLVRGAAYRAEVWLKKIYRRY